MPISWSKHHTPRWRARAMWPARARTRLPIGRGGPRLEAALSLLWRWRGVLEAKVADASGRLSST
eukprot:scaffold116994_cov69-Phaeocystis_antarctica.AAC.6